MISSEKYYTKRPRFRTLTMIQNLITSTYIYLHGFILDILSGALGVIFVFKSRNRSFTKCRK